MSSNTNAQLWTELLPQIKSFVDSSNYKKLSSILPKLLNDNNDLPETVRSTFTLIYIRSLLKTGSFPAAYEICTKPENKGQYVPEEAYALYRWKRYEECLDVCQKASSSINNVGLSYTHAQCLYRLHKTNEALDIYSKLFQTFQGVEEEKEEIATNALACLQSTYDKFSPHPSTQKWIYSHIPELFDSNSFNYDLANNLGAFLSLSSTNTSSMLKGEQVLRMAIKECETQLEEDGLSKDEILSEVLPIKANLAYALLMNGKMEEADKMLNHVLASTLTTTTSNSKQQHVHLPPSLQSARTSATNNIAVRRISTESVFDSLKRLTSSSGSGVGPGEERQQMISTPHMMRSLLFNKAILLSKMKNKEEECLDILKQLSSGNVTSPHHYSSNAKNDSKSKKNKKRSQSSKKGQKSMQEDNYMGFKMYAEIMEVEMLRGKGETKKAQIKLQSMMNEYEGLLQTEIQLYQTQLNIMEDSQGLKAALMLLEKLQSNDSGIQSKPAIIATLISIYQDMNKSKEASDLLSNLYINSNESTSSEQQARIISKKAMGEYYLKMDMYQEAIKVFQEILEMEGKDEDKDECLALLVIATSYLDGEEAEEKLSNLAGLEDEENLEEEKEELTGEALENMDIPWGTGGGSRRFLHQARGTDRGSKKNKKSKEAIQRYRAKKREAYLARLTEEGKYNPDKPTKPDPERWIPKNQRSSNRRRRNRRYGAGTSHQGIGSGMEDKRLDARARAAGEISVGNGAPSTAHMSVSSGGGNFKKNRKGKKR